MLEQRNAYKGSPPRPWIRIWLVAADGTTKDVDLLADTGNPCAVIVSVETMRRYNLGVTPGMQTNFGVLDGGWLRIQCPDLAFDEDLLGYSNNSVVEAAKGSCPEFEGLAGLPLLRMMNEFGGNEIDFWVRTSTDAN